MDGIFPFILYFSSLMASLRKYRTRGQWTQGDQSKETSSSQKNIWILNISRKHLLEKEEMPRLSSSVGSDWSALTVLTISRYVWPVHPAQSVNTGVWQSYLITQSKILKISQLVFFLNWISRDVSYVEARLRTSVVVISSHWGGHSHSDTLKVLVNFATRCLQYKHTVYWAWKRNCFVQKGFISP